MCYIFVAIAIIQIYLYSIFYIIFTQSFVLIHSISPYLESSGLGYILYPSAF